CLATSALIQRSFSIAHPLVSFVLLRPPPPPTLFPYTTLFRSQLGRAVGGADLVGGDRHRPVPVVAHPDAVAVLPVVQVAPLVAEDRVRCGARSVAGQRRGGPGPAELVGQRQQRQRLDRQRGDEGSGGGEV